jgi:NAD(P)-dependent dehydrogenase (short-subunit alcohol dehydrogenase family)
VNLVGSSAFVTGAASGLGAATAAQLVAAGMTVVLFDRDHDGVDAVGRRLGPAAVARSGDVTDDDAVALAVGAAPEPLRVAVNCAGIGVTLLTVQRDGSPGPLEPFRRMIEVNLMGTFVVMRHAAAAMARADLQESGDRGVIVNTASIAAFEGQRGSTGYAASKGAVVSLTLPAARDLAPLAIRVCTVAPGGFETPLMYTLDERQRSVVLDTVVTPRRIGRPDEFAALVRHIAENSYLNAEVIRLDAGMRMPPR